MTSPGSKQGIRYSLPFALALVCALGGVVALFSVLLFSSVYSIASDEVGVVLRFGEYRGTTGPGYGFKAPLVIDRVFKLPVDREMTFEFGVDPSQLDAEGNPVPVARENQVFLAADLEELSVAWTTAYRISDPVAYMFKNRSVVKLFGDMNESCVNDVVSSHTSTDLIASPRKTVADRVAQLLQSRCDRYETGLNVVRVEFHSIEKGRESE